MPAGAATGAGISVSIVRDPALVRTVRLVAAAVARRTGQDEEFVEEVRLAIGEACALMVGTEHEAIVSGAGPIRIEMRVGDRLQAHVASDGPVSVHDEPSSDIDGVEPWALLRGLIEDFAITQVGGTTTLSMSWPLV